MTEQQNTPALRFPGFSENWEIIKVRDLSQKTIGGGTPNTSKSNYWKGELNWIQSSDLSLDNLFKHRSKKYINDKALNNSSAKKIPANSIAIVSRVGVGKLVYINQEYATSQDFINLVHLNYPFKFIMYSLYLLLKGEANKLQGTSIKGLTKKDLLNYSLNIPKTIEEQEKIGVFFNKLDRQIELEEEKLELLEQQKKGYMQKIFSQELRFKDEKGHNHPSWKEMKLMEILSVIDGDRGKNYPTKNDFMEIGHTLFLSATNVTKQGFSLNQSQYITKEKSNSMGKGKLNINDVVLTTRGSIGNVFLYNEKIAKKKPFVRINSGMLILRTEDYIKSFFITKYLASPLGKKQIDLLSFGSAQPQLTKKNIELYKIKLPVRQEQKQISLFLKKIDKIIENQVSKIRLLKQRKKGLLQKMFV